MDVILDSNVYVSDYRTENISFKNLFDYLRRTGSSLVLLRIVREEVVAHFARDLKKRAKDASESWRAYRTLHFPSKLPEFRKPDINEQVKLLRKRLMKPSAAMKVAYHSDTTRISVDEISKRGIRRIPPANGDGEELRDVIVWLSTLDYAKTNKGEVAFITADSGFWLRDSVRPEIQKDIKESGVTVRLYRDIDRFVEENSPEAKAAEEKWANDVFPEFRDDVIIAAESAIRSRRAFQSIKSISLTSSRFKEGKVYVVAPGVQVAELSFTVDIQFEAMTRVALMAPLSTLAGPLALSPVGANVLPGPTAPGSNWASDAFSVLGSFDRQTGLGFNTFGAPGVGAQVHPNVIEGRYTLSGTTRVSARLLEGKISEKEVTDFQIERVIESKGAPAEHTK